MGFIPGFRAIHPVFWRLCCCGVVAWGRSREAEGCPLAFCATIVAKRSPASRYLAPLPLLTPPLPVAAGAVARVTDFNQELWLLSDIGFLNPQVEAI